MANMHENDERAAFEAAYIAEFSELKSISRNAAIEIAWNSGLGKMWRAGRRTLTSIDEDALPELPPPECLLPGVYAYRAATVERIRRDAIAAYKSKHAALQRERRCEMSTIKLTGPGLNCWFAEMLVKDNGPEGARECTSGPMRAAVEAVIAAQERAQVAEPAHNEIGDGK